MAKRGLFFFLPENASLADVPGLVRDLRAQIDLDFVERVAQAGAEGRVLLIQATDMDSGAGRAFDAIAATWRRAHPDAPIPKTRYWVIINEYIQPLPVTVQPTWPAIVERSRRHLRHRVRVDSSAPRRRGTATTGVR